jgi:hypothetical protein
VPCARTHTRTHAHTHTRTHAHTHTHTHDLARVCQPPCADTFHFLTRNTESIALPLLASTFVSLFVCLSCFFFMSVSLFTKSRCNEQLRRSHILCVKSIQLSTRLKQGQCITRVMVQLSTRLKQGQCITRVMFNVSTLRRVETHVVCLFINRPNGGKSVDLRMRGA